MCHLQILCYYLWNLLAVCHENSFYNIFLEHKIIVNLNSIHFDDLFSTDLKCIA